MANAQIPTLQIRAQTPATALEGIHNRLDSAAKPFTGMKDAAVKRARKAAQQAGVQALLEQGVTNPEIAENRFRESLGFVN